MQEPELLAEEQAHVERSIQANAVSHYRAFIASADCVQSVQQQLAAACGRLDALLDDLPQLVAACERFSRDAASVMDAHGQNKQLLGKHSWSPDHTVRSCCMFGSACIRVAYNM